MELSYGLTRPALPAGETVTLDLLLTFHADYSASRRPDRRPLSVSVVIDRSGSMSGRPLKQATEAAGLLVRQLSPRDTVSVVVYDSRVDTIVAPTRVTDPESIIKKVNAVRPAGATALHGGWLQGCEHAAEVPSDQAVRRVLLLTDGQANVGLTATPEIVAQAAKQAEEGVVTSALGFGPGFNEDLLIGMAEAGRGNFYYIESPDEATQLFLIEGESITAIGAQDLAVTLRPRRGVTVDEVIDARSLKPRGDGSLRVPVGDVYGGEDRHVALTFTVTAPEAHGDLELFDVEYRYDPVASSSRRGEVTETAVVSASVGRGDARPDPNVARAVSRLRVALAKERAVTRSDAGEHDAAAELLRREATQQRARGMDEEYEIAEEVSQLEHFADLMSRKRFDANARKALRDQSYQGRSRGRADLTARGAGGGSAASLDEASEVGSGVLLTCEREAGKLRVKARGERVDGALPVLIPRAVREEGAAYVADALEPSAHGTFYRVKGALRRLAKGAPAPGVSTGLQLDALFEGGGEPWLPLLKPVIEARPDAAEYIGPKRDPSVVPVRELTFQALKPNPPEKWKVVVFGQNPYPRVESATGIAMFDNTFNHWKDSQFGRVTSIRCIIKAAVMWKHRVPKATPIADIRALLAKKDTVQPPEWFQAMLTQGVLLLNASLTASADGGRGDADVIARHTAFWRPVIERVVEEILKAKQASADAADKGVVFAWWGTQARTLKGLVQRLEKKYPAVRVRHIDHPNPAAQGDIFCDGDHFGAVNAALKSLGMGEVDWLPSAGWNKPAAGAASGEADRMGAFINRTMELHKLYLERLQEVKEEPQEILAAITGVGELPAVAFGDAVAPLASAIKGLDHFAQASMDFAARKLASPAGSGGLDAHEVAALYLYTCDSGFYRQVNAALRDVDRAKVDPYKPYLRLLLSALGKIERFESTLWRGVAMDLRGQYPKGRTVTWWGVSSCTAKLSVAHSFLGSKGKRTLFSVKPLRAVGVRAWSAFSGEEEYLLAPGTSLTVVGVKAEKSGLCTVELEEVAGERGVR